MSELIISEPRAGAGRDERVEAATNRGSRGPALPWVRTVRTPQELEQLQLRAASDEHRVLAATHLIERDGEIVGYLGVGSLPVVMTWVDSKAVRSRESLSLLNLVENMVAARGLDKVCVPCAKNSPFRPYMAGLGYEYFGETGIFAKGLRV